MAPEQVIQQTKSTALNAIKKMYHPLWKSGFTYYEGEGSFKEQRDHEVQRIIEELEFELNKLKNK